MWGRGPGGGPSGPGYGGTVSFLTEHYWGQWAFDLIGLVVLVIILVLFAPRR